MVFDLDDVIWDALIGYSVMHIYIYIYKLGKEIIPHVCVIVFYDQLLEVMAILVLNTKILKEIMWAALPKWLIE